MIIYPYTIPRMKKKNWGMILVGVFLIFISIIAFAIQQLNAEAEESWD